MRMTKPPYTWVESPLMTSPPKRRARSTATRLLPTAVGPRTMTMPLLSGSNFDQYPDREDRGEKKESEELTPLQGASPTLSRLLTSADSWAWPRVRLTARTSATRTSSLLPRRLRRRLSPTMLAFTLSRDLISSRPP